MELNKKRLVLPPEYPIGLEITEAIRKYARDTESSEQAEVAFA